MFRFSFQMLLSNTRKTEPGRAVVQSRVRSVLGARDVHFALLACALSLAAAPQISAGTIVQTYTQPASNVTWSVPNIAFNQFNPSLGTLNAVTLTFVGSFTQTDLISVGGNVPNQTITAMTALSDVFLYDAANFGSNLGTVSSSAAVIGAPGVTINSGTSQTFVATGLIDSGSIVLPTSPYIGLGTRSFSLVGAAGYTKTGGDQIQLQSGTRSGGTLTLTYDYDSPSSVPEPGTLALVGMAIGALCYRRRS